jgi:hypothetical protein
VVSGLTESVYLSSTHDTHSAQSIERCEEPELATQAGRHRFLKICLVLCLFIDRESLSLVSIVAFVAVHDVSLIDCTHTQECREVVQFSLGEWES